jgi:hypothetical protein
LLGAVEKLTAPEAAEVERRVITNLRDRAIGQNINVSVAGL